ncbi:MAG: nitrogen fixation negative regulator NifL, partial [Alphaproteobacteria bacterium]|nr:nitrogen fixation negative regulator NifL [Alphaproteobacteria bacterium]
MALDVYRQAIEFVPVATSITDVRANILYANSAFERLTGYTKSEIVGLNESVLSDHATPPDTYRKLWAAITSGREWKGRLVNRRKDGTRYLADLTVVPILDAQGNPEYFLGMHRDVTDVHELESKLKNQNTLLSSLVEAAPALIALLNASGKVIFSNPAFEDLQREMPRDVLAPHFLRALNESLGVDLRSLCENGTDFSAVEARIETLDGEIRWFACSA